MNIVERLLRIMGSAWKSMLIAMVFGVFTISSNMGLLATSAYLISSAALHPSITELSVAIVGVRFFGISRAVFRYIERYISHDVTFRLLGAVRVWFYTKLEKLAPARVMEWQSGQLLNAIVGDVETLKEFYLRVLAPPMVAIVVLCGTCIFLAQYSRSFVYVIIGAFIMAGIVLPIFLRMIQKPAAQELVSLRGELRTQLVDSIMGIVDLSAFGQNQRQVQRIGEINQRLQILQGDVSKLTGLTDAIGLFMVNSTIWIILWLAIPLVHEGQLAGVYLAGIMLIVQSSFEAVLPLPLVLHYASESMAAGKRLFEIVDGENATFQVTSNIANNNICIEVKNVSFQYQSNVPFVLNNISFSAKPGQRVGIVGPSGAGKSTLVNLLLGFWDYQQGMISVGENEIRAYDPEKLRKLFGVVSQQTHLFNASIRDNILLAKPNASEAEFLQAVAYAELEEFIAQLPNGHDTMVGQNGQALSGGQRQRIAIARALLKNAPILILDEPTVGLDAVTEQLIMKTIEKLMSGRTTLLITHRVTSLETMDNIIVINEGEIAEQGRQSELLENRHLFYQLWNLQHDVI